MDKNIMLWKILKTTNSKISTERPEQSFGKLCHKYR